MVVIVVDVVVVVVVVVVIFFYDFILSKHATISPTRRHFFHCVCPLTQGIYEWDESRWEKMLYGCDESQVMELKPLDIRWHYDPLTWKFRTEAEHAWTVPTGS